MYIRTKLRSGSYLVAVVGSDRLESSTERKQLWRVFILRNFGKDCVCVSGELRYRL